MLCLSIFRTGLFVLILLLSCAVNAQNPLDAYVQQGLQSNLLLKQKNISLEKAEYALKSAGSMFLPSVNVNSSFTHGQGGRNIAIPVGDMLNPVYTTLNQLTDSDNFPGIDNVEQNFFPSQFYDAHVRTSMPLLNTSLLYNKSVQQDRVVLQEWEIKRYERELIAKIRQAYYQYISALESVQIYESALTLLQRNLEITKSMLENGKGLPASVLRASSELEDVKAQLLDAQNSSLNAQYYFNFLLNRAQDEPIEIDMNFSAALEKVPQLLVGKELQPDRREELQMIRTTERLHKTRLRMYQQNWVPRLGAFLDLGAQAENWEFNGKATYFLLGISMDIPVFNGLRNRYEVRQAKLDLKDTQLGMEQTKQQLELASRSARNHLATAYHNYMAAQKRHSAASGYFRLIERGYKEGTHSLIEFIDARSQLTTSQLQESIQTYQVLIALAQYEREQDLQLNSH